MKRGLLWPVVLAVALLLPGCFVGQPLRLGFIGSLSDRGADLGEAGRNGVILAVEQQNLAGGIHGRPIELVVRDDGQNADKAAGAMQSLIDARVEAVVGPFTSAMAAATVPLANQARLLLVSPMVTSTDFAGKDDFFIRISRSTREDARDHAQQLASRQQLRIAVAYDTANQSFSQSWLAEFRKHYMNASRVRVITDEVPFDSRADTSYGQVLRAMLANKPDGLLFIASALDVARLALQANKLAPELPTSAAEWAASESLIELGGRVVEGLLLSQSYNPSDGSARFRQFQAAYLERFGRQPGISAVASYDATTVLLQALMRRQRGEDMKEAVLRHGPFDGLQQAIGFDRFGDTQRRVYFTQVRDGQFVLVP